MAQSRTTGGHLPDTAQGITAFFYGTLMHPRILHRVVDATDTPTAAHLARFTHTPAILSNFCRHKVKKCDYPGIVAEAGKTVRGVYVAGLNENDMLRLDRFEGSQYVKEDVEVELLRGESLSGKGDGTHENPTRERELVKTQTYVFEDRQDLEDEEWDFEKFKKEKLQNWVGSTDEYDEVDAAGVNASDAETATTSHDPTGGRGVRSINNIA